MFNFTNSNSKPIANEVTNILKGLKEVIFGRIRKNNIKPTAAILASLKMPAAHLIRIIAENVLTNDTAKKDVFAKAMQLQVQLPGDLLSQHLAVHVALYLNELLSLEQEANYKGVFYSEDQRELATEYVKEIKRSTCG